MSSTPATGTGLARVAPLDAGGDPLRIGPPGGQLALQLAVEEQAALGIDRQLLPGPEPRPPHGDAFGQRYRARLGGDRDEVSCHRDP